MTPRTSMALTILVLFLFSLNLFAQQPPAGKADLDRRIQRQVRAYTEAPPEAKITLGARTPSDWPGYENLPVTIEAGGVKKDIKFLLAKDGSKLLYLTEIDLRQDPYVANMKKIDLTGRPFRGAENGPVNVVVYDDFQCPFCARMYVTLFNEVMVHYRDRVKVVMKDFPILDAHPWAMRAAVDAQCLWEQAPAAYWAFSDYVHTHQSEVSSRIRAKGTEDLAAMDALAGEIGQKHNVQPGPLQSCLARQDSSKVESSMAEGKSLGVTATPTMFVNGQEVFGVVNTEKLRLVLDQALSDAGVSIGSK
ncbi:MAG TPA: thioredoxin domain-containing protein [Candidatus Limnocylindrales bacterium]|nr:thioredoxin domain-containing protein [Candidatus Limnocylindrales bacterium]